MPSSMTYEVHDEKTKTKLLAAVTVVPNVATHYKITIPASAARLVSPTKYPNYSEEVHTITGTLSGGSGGVGKFYGTFLVRNLTFVQ